MSEIEGNAAGEGGMVGGPAGRLGAYANMRNSGPDADRGGESTGEAAETYEQRLAGFWQVVRDAIQRAIQESANPAQTNRWVSIGPAVVRKGQGDARPACAGRTVGIALAPAANRVYAATANGGVWRSDHGGRLWRSMMEAHDLNPTAHKSDSLACGAIAVDPTNPDRLFVGTGEGAASTAVAGGYGGVGVLRSTDGGVSWQREPVATGSPSLDGRHFFSIAIDPLQPERVVGATNQGLYLREAAGPGGFHWRQVRAGNFTSMVMASDGTTTHFFAISHSGTPVTATGTAAGALSAWSALGTGFPSTGTRRMTLACRANDPTIVYALVADLNNRFHSVWRLDTGIDTTWRQVGLPAGANNVPPRDLFGGGTTGQGWYDQAIAVDVSNPNRIYLGGSTRNTNGQWGSCIDRWLITRSGTGAATTFSLTAANLASIGGTVHADVHVLVVDPTDSNRLWVGCDGGVYLTTEARAAASTTPGSQRPRFTPMNTGLNNLTLNCFGQHPTSDGVVLAGAQDCGALRYTGDEVWYHASYGDGGHSVVDQANPYRMASIYNGMTVRIATDGAQEAYLPSNWGASPPQSGSWSIYQVPAATALFYPPLEGPPPDGTAAHQNRLAFGGDQVFISDNFGASWSAIGSAAPFTTQCTCITFALHDVLYAGDDGGRIYRYSRSGGTWTETRIDNAGGLGVAGWVADIAVDPTNSNAIWVSYAGRLNDWRRVWFFNGTSWSAASGPAGTPAARLLDVQHEAIVVDPTNRLHLYAGSDVGVWRSTDGGANWAPFSAGLPDAAVRDLKIHSASRLLRASLHGRGMWEIRLDSTSIQQTETYIRAHRLDQRRVPVVDGGGDPHASGQTVRLGLSPDIKIDVPDANGRYQTPSEHIDCLDFVDVITDRSDRVGTVASTSGTVVNRVYVQVHNRGPVPARGLRVTALIAKRGASGPPALPSGYTELLVSGQPINGNGWKSLGSETLEGLAAGLPQIAAFTLRSTDLPQPGALSGQDAWCVLVLMHDAEDPFVSTNTDVTALVRGERKAALHEFRVQAFTGTLPYPSQQGWVRIQPGVVNWPVDAGPPTFQVRAEENGRVVIELAWDPQALMAPSIGYDDADALRYYSTSLDFDKSIRAADGSTLRVRVAPQPLVTQNLRLDWTLPADLWRGYQEEARKRLANQAGAAFPLTLYYRVRLTPTGAATATLWPADEAIRNQPDAPHMGIVARAAAPSADFPDAEVLASLDWIWALLLRAWWGSLPETDPDRQALQRILAHNCYRQELGLVDRGRLLQLWLLAGPRSRSVLDRLLDRRVWTSADQDGPAVLRPDRRGGLNLLQNLLELHSVTPHADLAGVTSPEQLVDDVITEIIDPNGQVNQGESGMGPPSAIQTLLLQVNPAEYVRLQRGWLSHSGSATLASGDTATIPPAIFQVARYGSAQTRAFSARTFAELAFQSAILKYGQGSRFPQYDPTADPGAPNGVDTVFQATIRGGLTLAETQRALQGLFSRAFTASASGPSAAVSTALQQALAESRVPIVMTLRWGGASGGHGVLGLRVENGRLFFRNPHYAGSSPPTGHTAGATLADPPRRVEDPTQCLESIEVAQLATQVLWFVRQQGALLE